MKKWICCIFICLTAAFLSATAFEIPVSALDKELAVSAGAVKCRSKKRRTGESP